MALPAMAAVRGASRRARRGRRDPVDRAALREETSAGAGRVIASATCARRMRAARGRVRRDPAAAQLVSVGVVGARAAIPSAGATRQRARLAADATVRGRAAGSISRLLPRAGARPGHPAGRRAPPVAAARDARGRDAAARPTASRRTASADAVVGFAPGRRIRPRESAGRRDGGRTDRRLTRERGACCVLVGLPAIATPAVR